MGKSVKRGVFYFTMKNSPKTDFVSFPPLFLKVYNNRQNEETRAESSFFFKYVKSGETSGPKSFRPCFLKFIIIEKMKKQVQNQDFCF